MKAFDLSKKREVCWDFDIVEKNDGINLKMKEAERKNLVFESNRPWEGHGAFFPSVLKVGDTYRLYYRAYGALGNDYKECFCVAESKDGINFTRPNLGLYEHDGAKDNNIMFVDPSRFVDNFTVHYDTNPDCPPDEKYKAVSLYFCEDPLTTDLWYYKSADGYKFEFVKALPFPGVFDTHNIVLWDDTKKEYKAYVRNFHNADGSTTKYAPTAEMDVAFRDVRVTTSKDFVNWTEPVKLEYTDMFADDQLYTSQIIKYPRADIFFGMPTRYVDRKEDAHNFKYLPNWGGTRTPLTDKLHRYGTAVTDCTIMTSRDGFKFHRQDEAFIAPGLERDNNWYYGECYFSHGVVETEIEDYPGLTELSFYVFERYEYDKMRLYRYTVRLDGFFSWQADRKGGTLLTKPVTIDADSLNINFKTSTFGYVRFRICDEDGNPIEGYDSKKLMGNSLARPVDFDKPLSLLKGKTVRLEVSISDAELFSYIFE